MYKYDKRKTELYSLQRDTAATNEVTCMYACVCVYIMPSCSAVWYY